MFFFFLYAFIYVFIFFYKLSPKLDLKKLCVLYDKDNNIFLKGNGSKEWISLNLIDKDQQMQLFLLKIKDFIHIIGLIILEYLNHFITILNIMILLKVHQLFLSNMLETYILFW